MNVWEEKAEWLVVQGAMGLNRMNKALFISQLPISHPFCN